eukprot:TRINITY_DN36955_c0_g1_i1.p1 TRINITY_DN36955_c0_g1~~TRINITY_DN36955_c0_g1_i1.p1  ORF type:complete len:322 (+),score=33.19 TRINITY_DN36955_c0_g1_i1:112-1077(+)
MGKRDRQDDIITFQSEKLKKCVKEIELIFKSAPKQFVVQCLSSALGFTAGLATVQVVSMGVRVSCCTPVMGPIMGVIGVGLSSAVAGQVSFAVEESMNGRKFNWQNPYVNVNGRDVVWDALCGIVIFKIAGGSYRNILPSDVVKPGAMAVESLPAKGKEYVTGVQKLELQRLYKKYGCHHCGSKGGAPIGDHMPCNKFVWGGANEPPKYKTITNPAHKWIRQSFGLPVGPPDQRYFPQCRRCSNFQSAVVRRNKGTKLILHFGSVQPQHLTGVVVGLRKGRNYRQQSLRGGGKGNKKFIHQWKQFQDEKSLDRMSTMLRLQ